MQANKSVDKFLKAESRETLEIKFKILSKQRCENTNTKTTKLSLKSKKSYPVTQNLFIRTAA